MNIANAEGSGLNASRIDWVDYAKGICIILVVMMHSTLGVEKAVGATGYLHAFIEWAKPFRMPDFFLISGLFLARRIDVPWRSYLDSKVLHFAYFYILWMTIQFGLKGPGIVMTEGMVPAVGQYLLGFIEPFGTLWFIYLLAIFFVVTKLLRGVPPFMVFIMAAILEMLPLHTGWMVVDEFAARFVYFFAGYWLASLVFQAADKFRERSVIAVLAMLYIWSTGHSLAVVAGMSELPGMGLLLGFAGAGAVIATGVLLARSGKASALRYIGANSIVIYLSFFLFMAGSRSVLLKLAPAMNVDMIAAVVTAAGLIGPVLLYWLVRKTPLSLLFSRPQWAKLKTVATPAKQTYSAAHDISLLKRPQTR
jgi:uncharacterized membrane protein YcfT